MMPPVAILAGGLGTRLHPLTRDKPKSLLEVAGKPFIFHQLGLLKRQGFSQVVLCAGRFGEKIREYAGNGSAWDLAVQYSFDGDRPLGTGGALKKAAPLLPEKFFVLYGDSYLDIDPKPILERFEREGKPALLTAYRNNGQWDQSNVLLREGRILKYDKKNPSPDMKHIDYGLSILKKSVVAGWPAGQAFDLADAYHELVECGQMATYETKRRFYEIGSAEGIEELAQYLNSCNKSY